MQQRGKAKPWKGEKEWNQVWKPFPFIRMVIWPQTGNFSNVLVGVSFEREWISPWKGMAALQLSEISGLEERQNTFAKLQTYANNVVFHYLLGQLNTHRLSRVPVLLHHFPVSSLNFSHNKRIQQIHSVVRTPKTVNAMESLLKWRKKRHQLQQRTAAKGVQNLC